MVGNVKKVESEKLKRKKWKGISFDEFFGL